MTTFQWLSIYSMTISMILYIFNYYISVTLYIQWLYFNDSIYSLTIHQWLYINNYISMTLLGDCKLCLKRQKRSDYETGAIRLNFRRITLSCSRAFRKMKRTAISFITFHVVQRIRINHLRCQETTYKQEQFIRSNIDHYPEVSEMIKKKYLPENFYF